MNPELFVSRILDDEGLTEDLDEEAAAKLVGWLVRQVERIAADADSEAAAWQAVEQLCRRARDLRPRLQADPGLDLDRLPS